MNSKAIIVTAVIVSLLIGAGFGIVVFPRVNTVTSFITTILTKTLTATSIVLSTIEVVKSQTITVTQTLTRTPKTITTTKISPTTITVTRSVTSKETTGTHTPTSERGTYDNPALVGEAVTVEYDGSIFEVTALEYTRGPSANREIMKANIFNPEPKEGYEYLLVKVKVAYISGHESERISSADFKAYVKGAGYSSAWVVLPDDKPKLEGVNLLPGGEVEGWIAFEVPINEKVLLGFQPGLEPLCFIKME